MVPTGIALPVVYGVESLQARQAPVVGHWSVYHGRLSIDRCEEAQAAICNAPNHEVRQEVRNSRCTSIQPS